MSAVNENKNKYRTIAKTCYATNTIYLFLYVFYLILFIIAKTYIMVYIAAGIIGIHLIYYGLIKFRKYYPYTLAVGNEFLAFIIVSSLMLGFNTGFHFFLIAFIVVSFFATYFSKSKRLRGSYIWVGMSIAIYLTLFFVGEFVNPYYAVDKWLEITLFTIHAILCFLLITAFLTVFVKYTLSLENKIKNESRTDELTGIANRYGLYDYFDNNKDRSSMALALFDIDDFKGVNDTYGHAAGDIVLKRIAEIATSSLDGSFVCRYGGEEFVIVMEDNKQNSYFDRLELFRKLVEKETFIFDDKEVHLTITIGAVKYEDRLRINKWVDLADKKMYSGKKSGKNKTVI